MDSIITRFEGEEGARRLRGVLAQQKIIGNDDAVLAELQPIVKLRELATGSELIRQGDATNSIYFVLIGAVSILINGRHVATRRASDHVGEIAMADASAPRSATVVGAMESLIGEVAEADFVKIAEKFPDLWRRIAVELGNRLRERSLALREPNEVPRMFIGSTVEALSIAREIQAALDHDKILATVWTDDVFGASEATIESLEKALDEADFACLVVTGDDVVESRGKEQNAPRDNVIFELGLFMGRLGRDRVFMFRPRDVDIKIPSDLYGISMIGYPSTAKEKDLTASLGAPCNQLRKLVKGLGPR